MLRKGTLACFGRRSQTPVPRPPHGRAQLLLPCLAGGTCWWQMHCSMAPRRCHPEPCLLQHGHIVQSRRCCSWGSPALIQDTHYTSSSKHPRQGRIINCLASWLPWRLQLGRSKPTPGLQRRPHMPLSGSPSPPELWLLPLAEHTVGKRGTAHTHQLSLRRKQKRDRPREDCRGLQRSSVLLYFA